MRGRSRCGGSRGRVRAVSCVGERTSSRSVRFPQWNRPRSDQPGRIAPGTNDFSCTPSAAHPDPVVLVHGTAANRQTNWGVLAPVLVNEGHCVFALTFGNRTDQPWPISAAGGLAPLGDSAGQLSDFVDDVLSATGASKVDLIGHSQGTTVSAYYAKFLGGDEKVSKIVSIAPLWDGSEVGPPEASGDRISTTPPSSPNCATRASTPMTSSTPTS